MTMPPRPDAPAGGFFAGLAQALDSLEGEARLVDFIALAWSVLEPPSRPFVRGWHVEAIAEHLEAVTSGDIRRLLVSIPPGCMKSLTTKRVLASVGVGPEKHAGHALYRRLLFARAHDPRQRPLSSSDRELSL